jgi:hypothetical protein
MRRIFFLCLCLAHCAAGAVEEWQTALERMPLGTNVTQLNRSNCVGILLRALQSNNVVKALIFMPGATDEFYMFRRAKAALTNASPSLLDAVNALTNQTLIRATFRPPLLLLHSDEDPLDPACEIRSPATEIRIRRRSFVPHALYNDRDWDFLLPILRGTFHLRFSPRLHSASSWHFYRHSFAGWNLSGWEALEAISLAGKSRFTVARRQVLFVGDERTRSLPTLNPARN